jgi:hypothetical protein
LGVAFRTFLMCVVNVKEVNFKLNPPKCEFVKFDITIMMVISMLWQFTIERKAQEATMHLPMFTIWHVQEGTNVFQDEVIALEKASFFLCEQHKCSLWNLFSDKNSIHVHQPFDVNSRPKSCNNKTIQHLWTFKILN